MANLNRGRELRAMRVAGKEVPDSKKRNPDISGVYRAEKKAQDEREADQRGWLPGKIDTSISSREDRERLDQLLSELEGLQPPNDPEVQAELRRWAEQANEGILRAEEDAGKLSAEVSKNGGSEEHKEREKGLFERMGNRIKSAMGKLRSAISGVKRISPKKPDTRSPFDVEVSGKASDRSEAPTRQSKEIILDRVSSRDGGISVFDRAPVPPDTSGGRGGKFGDGVGVAVESDPYAPTKVSREAVRAKVETPVARTESGSYGEIPIVDARTSVDTSGETTTPAKKTRGRKKAPVVPDATSSTVEPRVATSESGSYGEIPIVDAPEIGEAPPYSEPKIFGETPPDTSGETTAPVKIGRKQKKAKEVVAPESSTPIYPEDAPPVVETEASAVEPDELPVFEDETPPPTAEGVDKDEIIFEDIPESPDLPVAEDGGKAKSPRKPRTIVISGRHGGTTSPAGGAPVATESASVPPPPDLAGATPPDTETPDESEKVTSSTSGYQKALKAVRAGVSAVGRASAKVGAPIIKASVPVDGFYATQESASVPPPSTESPSVDVTPPTPDTGTSTPPDAETAGGSEEVEPELSELDKARKVFVDLQAEYRKLTANYVKGRETSTSKKLFEQIQEAQKEYEKVLKEAAQFDYLRKELNLTGTDEEIEEGKKKLTAEIFEKYVVAEQQRLLAEQAESFPPKERGIILNLLQRWGSLPKVARWTILTAVATGAAALSGLGGAALFGYAGSKWIRSAAAGLTTMFTERATEGAFRIMDKTVLKKMTAEGKTDQMREGMSGGFEQIDSQFDTWRDEYAKILAEDAKRKRYRNILKWTGAILAGGVAGMSLGNISNADETASGLGEASADNHGAVGGGEAGNFNAGQNVGGGVGNSEQAVGGGITSQENFGPVGPTTFEGGGNLGTENVGNGINSGIEGSANVGVGAPAIEGSANLGVEVEPQGDEYIVGKGEGYWHLVERHLEKSLGHEPTDGEIMKVLTDNGIIEDGNEVRFAEAGDKIFINSDNEITTPDDTETYTRALGTQEYVNHPEPVHASPDSNIDVDHNAPDDLDNSSNPDYSPSDASVDTSGDAPEPSMDGEPEFTDSDSSDASNSLDSSSGLDSSTGIDSSSENIETSGDDSSSDNLDESESSEVLDSAKQELRSGLEMGDTGHKFYAGFEYDSNGRPTSFEWSPKDTIPSKFAENWQPHSEAVYNLANMPVGVKDLAIKIDVGLQVYEHVEKIPSLQAETNMMFDQLRSQISQLEKLAPNVVDETELPVEIKDALFKY